ncbi:MAG: hypothetical protein OXC91_14210 [Rhodobacteraceae bacterium]|nr:hypothetical protein [Paracoccaceae bacterium]
MGRRFYRPYPHRMMDAHALSDSDVKRLFEFARSLDDAPQNIVLPPAIVKILRSKMKTLGERLNHEILRCFGLSGTNALIREGSGSPLRVMIRNRNSEQVQEYAFTFGERTELNAMMPDDPGLQINIDHEKSAGYFRRLHEEFLAGSSDGSFGSPASELLSFLAKSALHSLFGSLSVPAYYLPADRTGVMHAHSVVVSALIASAPTAGLRPSARTPILSGVLADFLEELIEIP